MSSLSELRVVEHAAGLSLSVLVFVDDTFWVARRWTLETAGSAASGRSSLRDTTAPTPTRWEPPSSLDPRRPRPLRLVQSERATENRATPAESAPCRTALVVSNRTVLGVLELSGVRCLAHNRDRADALMARVAAQLAAWVESAPEPRARLVIGPRGVSLRTEDASFHDLPPIAGLATLLEEDPRQRLRRFGFGLATVKLEPLDGPAGPHLLVTVSRPSFLVLQQELPLTSRQREIADLASRGLTIGEIAAATKLAPDTIKSHLKTVYRILGVANRIELRELLDDR